jgi:hypothetical protein
VGLLKWFHGQTAQAKLYIVLRGGPGFGYLDVGELGAMVAALAPAAAPPDRKQLLAVGSPK